MSSGRRSRSLSRAEAVVRRIGDGLRSLGSPQLADEIPPPPLNVVPLHVPNALGPINVAIEQNVENEIRQLASERGAQALQQGLQVLQPSGPVPLLGRIAGLSSGLDLTSSSDEDRSRRSSRHSSRSRSGSYRVRNRRHRDERSHRAESRLAQSVRQGQHSGRDDRSHRTEGRQAQSVRPRQHSGREEIRHSGNVGTRQVVDTEESQANMSSIVSMIRDLTQEIATIKDSQLRGVLDARLNSLESVSPPKLVFWGGGQTQ